MSVVEPDPLSAAISRLEKSADDADAWAVLYQRTWAYVLGVSHSFVRRSGGIAAAEDVAQNVYYSLSRALHEGRLRLPRNEAELFALLAQMTRNLALDTFRWDHRDQRDVRRRQQSELSDDELSAGTADSPDHVETDDLIQHLLSRLDALDREILRMRLDGHTLEEIARKLNRSTKTIQRHLRFVGSEFQRITAQF